MEIKELWQVARELVGEEELTRRFRAWIGTLIRNARLKREKCDSTALEAQDTLSILSDLNGRTKSRFQATDKATHLIVTLLKKGYVVEDFKRVHEVKCGQWLGNEKMEHCLRPSTLYAPSHFDEYLAEWWKQDRERKELQQKRQQATMGMRAESLEAYPMPERIRTMRKAPGMLMQVASGKVAEWAEVEYRELKQEAKHGKN